MNTKNNGFWVLDVIRFTLGIYILIYHTWGRYPAFVEHLDLFRVFGLGNLATSVFFVLSGFLLTHVYLARNAVPKIEKRPFLAARLANIYPLHVVGLLLALPLIAVRVLKDGAMMVPGNEAGTIMRALGTDEILFSLGAFLTLTHAWILDPNLPMFNVPSWSLSALMFYYLLFPYIAPSLNAVRSPMRALVILGVGFCIPAVAIELLALDGPVVEGVLHHHPLVRMPLFLAGILLYTVYQRTQANPDGAMAARSWRPALWLIVGVCSLIGMWFFVPRMEGQYPLIRGGLYYPAALALIWLAATSQAGIAERPRKWLARLAKSSLSLFVLHSPLYALLMRVEQVVYALLTREGQESLRELAVRANDMPLLAELYVFHLLVVIGLSVVVQEKIANPLGALLREKLGGKRSVAAQPARPAGGAHEKIGT